MSEELRPCPFCGGKARKVTETIDPDDLDFMTFDDIDDPDCFEITCENERCINGWYLSQKDWNTRPIEDALNARIAELEAERRWKDSNVELPKEDTDGNALLVICRYSGEWARAPFGIEFSDEFVRHYSHWMIAPQLPEVQK